MGQESLNCSLWFSFPSREQQNLVSTLRGTEQTLTKPPTQRVEEPCKLPGCKTNGHNLQATLRKNKAEVSILPGDSQDLPPKAGDTRGASLIPGSGRSPGRGNGNLREKSMDRGAWRATVHEVAKELDVTEHACTRPSLKH